MSSYPGDENFSYERQQRETAEAKAAAEAALEATLQRKAETTPDALVARAQNLTDKYGTHWDGCWESHPKCLALALAAALTAERTARQQAEQERDEVRRVFSLAIDRQSATIEGMANQVGDQFERAEKAEATLTTLRSQVEALRELREQNPDAFLAHVERSTTSYSEGWRAMAAELRAWRRVAAALTPAQEQP